MNKTCNKPNYRRESGLSTDTIKTKLRLIMEGHYVDGQDEIVNESVALGAIAGVLLTAMVALIVKDSKQANKKYLEMKDKSIDSDEKKELREKFLSHTSKEKLIQNMKNDIKKMVDKAKMDKKFMDDLKKRVADELPKYGEDPSNNRFKLIYRDWWEDYVELVDADQIVTSILTKIFIRDVIQKALEIKYVEPIKLGIVKLDTGDGDEGCLYFE